MTRSRLNTCTACGTATPSSSHEAIIPWWRPGGTPWRTSGPSQERAPTTGPGPPTPPTPGCSPEPGRGDAADYEALRESVGQQHRAHGDDRAGKEPTVGDVRVGIFAQ